MFNRLIEPPVMLILKTAAGQRVQVVVVRRPVAMTAAHWQSLTAAERERAGLMKHPQRQIEYVAGHALLNGLLAQQGDDWETWTEPSGRPAARIGGRNMAISLSHSGGWICAAVAPLAALGVDIEASPRKRDFQRLARRMGWPEDLDRERFLRRWALWEATGKSKGQGALRLHDPLFDRLAAAADQEVAGALVHGGDHGALLAPLVGLGWLGVVAAGGKFTEMETTSADGIWNTD